MFSFWSHIFRNVLPGLAMNCELIFLFWELSWEFHETYMPRNAPKGLSEFDGHTLWLPMTYIYLPIYLSPTYILSQIVKLI
jgi:hypothetical protein